MKKALYLVLFIVFVYKCEQIKHPRNAETTDYGITKD